MTRPAADVERVFALAAQGLSMKAIAARAGVARATVRAWLERGIDEELRRRAVAGATCSLECRAFGPPSNYAYLFGAYLGDGLISAMARGVFWLRLFCDSRYPGIIESWRRAVATSLPVKVSVSSTNCNMRIIGAYSKHWPHLFPQCGPGPKHKRPIVLEP